MHLHFGCAYGRFDWQRPNLKLKANLKLLGEIVKKQTWKIIERNLWNKGKIESITFQQPKTKKANKVVSNFGFHNTKNEGDYKYHCYPLKTLLAHCKVIPPL